MGINLSIKNAPEDLVMRLKLRARRNHRSLQGEMLDILTRAADGPEPLTPRQLLDAVRRRGVATPPEAAAMVREDRNGRERR